MLPTRQHSLRGARVRLFSRAASKGAPTLLALHGYPDTLGVFGPLITSLPRTWGVLAADFPGQGGSEDTRCTAPRARAEWLVDVLAALEVRGPLQVFAHDMGAHVALELGLLVRDIERMVLSHSLLDGSGPTSLSIRMLRASGAYRVLLPAFPHLVVSRCLQTFLPKGGSLTAEVEQDIRSSFANGGARCTATVCDDAELWLERGLAAFASLKVELVWGDAEQHFPIEHTRALPNASVRVVKGGHHWLCWHAPQELGFSRSR